MQPVPQLGIMHVGFPGQQRGRLAIAQHGRELLIRQFGQDRAGGDPGRGKAASPLPRRACAKMSGMSSVIAAAELHADRADQHEAAKPFRHHAGQLGRDPATERAADQVELGMAELREQFQVEQGDIVRPVEPVGQRRSTEAGMRGRDDPAPPAQQADERVARGRKPPAPCRNRTGGPSPPSHNSRSTPASVILLMDIRLPSGCADSIAIGPGEEADACDLTRCATKRPLGDAE